MESSIHDGVAGGGRVAVVMIDDGRPVRGGARSGLELLRNLDHWSPTVFLNRQGSLSDAVATTGLPLEVLDVPPPPAEQRAWRHLGKLGQFQFRLHRAVGRDRYAILHCDFEALAWVVGLRVSRRLPLTTFLRANFYRPRPYVTRQKLRAVSSLFVLTEAQRRMVQGWHPRPVAVVPNSLSPDDLARAAQLSHRQIDKPTGRIGVVGAIVPEKGCAEFLEDVARRLRCASSILIVGDERDREYAARCRAAANRLAYPVDFVGWRDDVWESLAKIDLLVIPSFSEGLPRVALEAQAAGIPVIAAPFAGADESVSVGISGYVASSPADMARTIDAVLDDTAAWRRLRAAGPAVVANRTTGKQAAAIIERAWDALSPTVARVP